MVVVSVLDWLKQVSAVAAVQLADYLYATTQLLRYGQFLHCHACVDRMMQMRIIKEHGPPVFDAAEARAVDMLTQLSNGTGTDSPAASHSGLSAGSGMRLWAAIFTISFTPTHHCAFSCAVVLGSASLYLARCVPASERVCPVLCRSACHKVIQ